MNYMYKNLNKLKIIFFIYDYKKILDFLFIFFL
ncbi:hypothetical protein GUU_04771 [Malacoplasma iowae 695]|nr:hypothetical protein GUU_04771 [Malacoplasma iowae 695]